MTPTCRRSPDPVPHQCSQRAQGSRPLRCGCSSCAWGQSPGDCDEEEEEAAEEEEDEEKEEDEEEEEEAQEQQEEEVMGKSVFSRNEGPNRGLPSDFLSCEADSKLRRGSLSNKVLHPPMARPSANGKLTDRSDPDSQLLHRLPKLLKDHLN